jgi:glutathione S-transferase
MDLYLSPLACSMAARITLYEAGATARFIEAKRTIAGDDFYLINPLGLVPVIRTDDGEALTESAAILQTPNALSEPAWLRGREWRARACTQWLSFISTELQKGLFTALFDAKIPEQAKARALEKGDTRLAFLDGHLRDREFLLDDFSVADAYLFMVLNWSLTTPIDLTRRPANKSYYERLKQPSIARALKKEHKLYAAEQARHKAA